MATKRSTLLRAMMIFDLIVMLAAFGLATWSVYQAAGAAFFDSFDDFLSVRIKLSNVLLMAAFLYGWHFVYEVIGIYRSQRMSSELVLVRDILVATSLGTFMLLLLALVLEISLVNLSFLGIFWLTSTGTIIVSRLVLRRVLARIRLAGRNLRHVAVVGTNQRALDYVEMIRAKPELGYRFIGFVDDTAETRTGSDLPIVAGYDQFGEFVRNTVVDEIVIFSPLRSQYDRIAAIIEIAEAQGIIIRFGSNPFALKIGRSVVDQVGDVALSTIQTGSMYGHPSLGAKTVLDFVISAVAVLLLSPLLAVVAILIKKDSPGPVLFAQERLGLNKRRFRIYKFRTMRQDAEQIQSELEDKNEMDGPVFKIKDDPRITPFGKWLRNSSIDELPQLFNVLKGDMSLVGPRPLPVRDFNGFNSDIHRRRFSVKPGITCLWQISGRNNISFDKWMELDMNYIDHWSFWLDLKILIKNIPAVLTRNGAE